MRELLLGLARGGEVLAEPPLADLRVAAWADRVLSQRAERVFGGHDEFGGGERGDEDDAAVGLEREGIWGGCV